MLSMLLPAAVLKRVGDDVFSQERVCVHVFNRQITLPEPFLKQYKDVPPRAKLAQFFHVGIPELLVCATPVSFVEFFNYFWPITREEFLKAQRRIAIQYQVSTVVARKDIDELQRYLKDYRRTLHSNEQKTALLATLNDYTKHWMTDVLEIWRASPLDEVVIFKDPTRSPYLCEYPALQKGFKRPPP